MFPREVQAGQDCVIRLRGAFQLQYLISSEHLGAMGTVCWILVWGFREADLGIDTILCVSSLFGRHTQEILAEVWGDKTGKEQEGHQESIIDPVTTVCSEPPRYRCLFIHTLLRHGLIAALVGGAGRVSPLQYLSLLYSYNQEKKIKPSV